MMKERETLRMKKIPEGPLPLLIAGACAGDVLSVPCFVYAHSDDVLGTHEYTHLYVCVLLTSRSHVVLSKAYEQITDIEPVASVRVYPWHKSVLLTSEHGEPIAWHSARACRLLRRRRHDLAEAYFESLTPEGPVNGTH